MRLSSEFVLIFDMLSGQHGVQYHITRGSRARQAGDLVDGCEPTGWQEITIRHNNAHGSHDQMATLFKTKAGLPF